MTKLKALLDKLYSNTELRKTTWTKTSGGDYLVSFPIGYVKVEMDRDGDVKFALYDKDGKLIDYEYSVSEGWHTILKLWDLIQVREQEIIDNKIDDFLAQLD